MFFVISGFLIIGPVLDQLRAGSFTMSGFYLRRARRILPALLLMLFVVSLLSLAILMPDELQNFAKLLLASVAFDSQPGAAQRDRLFRCRRPT